MYLDILLCALLVLVVLLSGFSAWRLAGMGQVAEKIALLEARIDEQRLEISALKMERAKLEGEKDSVSVELTALKAVPQADPLDQAALDGVDGFLNK